MFDLGEGFDLGDVQVYEVHSGAEDLMNIPTQTLFFNDISGAQTKRHARPVNDDELTKRLQDRIPLKTRQATDWTVRVFHDWAEERSMLPETLTAPYAVPTNVLESTDEQLNHWLGRFIIEARRKDGNPYPSGTLSNIVAGIQRHLRENGRFVNFFKKDDPTFMLFRQSMDSRMKELTAAGVGVMKNRADPITLADENALWQNVFETKSALAYSYAVFFYNCKLFGLRGMDEHKDLQVDQYVLGEDAIGKYLEFFGRVSKNMQGGLDHRKLQPKVVKQYADATNSRCVVNLFSEYISYVGKGILYKRPLPTKPGDTPKFSDQPVGVNTLSQYMKKMFEKAGIDTKGRNITNHSGKVTCCSTLYNAGFPDKAVMGRSGHRSSAVQVYQRETDAYKKSISDTLQPPRPTEDTKENIKPVEYCGEERVSDAKEHAILKICVPNTITCIEIEKNGKKIKIEI